MRKFILLLVGLSSLLVGDILVEISITSTMKDAAKDITTIADTVKAYANEYNGNIEVVVVEDINSSNATYTIQTIDSSENSLNNSRKLFKLDSATSIYIIKRVTR